MHEPLVGGRSGGAELVDGTVRRPTGPWTPAVHALLRHLEAVGFDGAPRVLGIDAAGREELTLLAGVTVGAASPWPGWTHSEDALVEVAGWLRRYHGAVADFRPSPGTSWRADPAWRPGLIVGHGDAAPYNACWDLDRHRLVGFFDWDLAGPVTLTDDLAAVAFSWMPLHARHVVAAEGFDAFADRPARLRTFLAAYGWAGSPAEVVTTVRRQLLTRVDRLRRAARAGDPTFVAMGARGVDRDLLQAYAELGTVTWA